MRFPQTTILEQGVVNTLGAGQLLQVCR
jgi:hypothetical protein